MNELISITRNCSWYRVVFMVKGNKKACGYLAACKVQGLKKLVQYIKHNNIVHTAKSPLAFVVEKLVKSITVQAN